MPCEQRSHPLNPHPDRVRNLKPARAARNGSRASGIYAPSTPKSDQTVMLYFTILICSTTIDIYPRHPDPFFLGDIGRYGNCSNSHSALSRGWGIYSSQHGTCKHFGIFLTSERQANANGVGCLGFIAHLESQYWLRRRRRLGPE